MISFGISQATQAIRNAGAAGKELANSSTGGNSNCFIAGTLVLCRDGNGNECHKRIEDIAVGDYVWSYDEETGESDWKPVVRLFRNETEEWYHVYVNGEEIICTAEHPFYVTGKGFISAKQLKVSDKLLQSDGKEVIIESIEIEHLENPETTYNFEVEDFHTYYVTQSEILTHNQCTGKVHDENQRAVVALAKEAQKTGITAENADALMSWAKEYNFPVASRGPETSVSGIWSNIEHYHIAGINHIKLIK